MRVIPFGGGIVIIECCEVHNVTCSGSGLYVDILRIDCVEILIHKKHSTKQRRKLHSRGMFIEMLCHLENAEISRKRIMGK